MKDRIIAHICGVIEKVKADQKGYIEMQDAAHHEETRKYLLGHIVARDAMIADLRDIILYVEKVFSEEGRNGDV